MTLPYDQIPQDRRTIGDFTDRLDEHNGVLGVALAQWMARDDRRAQPEVRQAANTAMGEIDAMPRDLHTLRARLASEIRESDDIAMETSAALLEQTRHARRPDMRASAPAQRMTRGYQEREP